MPQNSTNRVAELEPLSHFFAHLDSPSWATQSATQAYGPLSSSPGTDYRVTSSFNTSSNLKAYAICKGTALVVQQAGAGNSNKVNLILRPFTQPIKGLAIKFFVYRGLNKSDFFTGSNSEMLVANIPASNTDLVNRVWEDYIAFNQEDPPITLPPMESKWIGFDPAILGAEIIDKRFFNVNTATGTDPETKEYELPMVNMGDYIGNFNGDFGLDVVLSDGDVIYEVSSTGFQFDLDYARAKEWSFSTRSMPAGYAEKQYKEAVLQFMDPAAFIGLHVGSLGKLKYKSNSTVAGEMDEYIGQDIYDNAMAAFMTKNKVYVHIMAENGRSYDFYDNYSSIIPDNTAGVNIRTGIDPLNLTEGVYGTDGWPVWIHSESQIAGQAVNHIYCQLTSNRSNYNIYCELGLLGDPAEANFIVSSSERLESEYSEIIDMVVINTPQGIDIGTLVLMQFRGAKINAIEESIDAAEIQITDLDLLFSPLRAVGMYTNDGGHLMQKGSGKNRSLIDLSIKKGNQTGLICAIPIMNWDFISDPDNGVVGRFSIETNIIAQTTVVQSDVTPNVEERNLEVAKYESFTEELNNHYSSQFPQYHDFKDVTISYKQEKLIHYSSPNKQNITKFGLGLSSEELQSIKDLCSSNGWVNCFLSVFALGSFLSLENHQYFEFGFRVVGESEYGALKWSSTSEPILLRTADLSFYSSKDYSKNMFGGLSEPNELEITG